ncbi:homodimeric glycerol 3-phosphate dehydrogenase (quinone) [Paenibacillus sp. 1_12]|uniref:glycerol-3-phosphate dehydrogenase/oxidase n=1 Tax=Paenibacillus sp. 1_12 TaxID=1566278 RepID=UPI0008EE2CC8|nr:glycerol-3-phosphate dehydrogenase/oxidase [Paenibacillus sp. 1_12]SFK74635.1 homodimeric glycerol 3-phosphate dehydrogenase (quinone) [Paenibacillus sp. 1_12]
MSLKFSGEQRTAFLNALGTETLDILVIGGGITGAGIALDAQTRGMSTGLIEMQDFAAGTSSRSTKLIHGGLRYLKQLEFKLVAEVGKERAIVYENAPHVTTPEWMLLPIIEGGTYGKLATSVGLLVYDFLAGVTKQERRVMLSLDATLKKEPLLRKDKLKGGGYYVEYRTDDARLTIEVMKEAVRRGVKAVNYAKANELLYDDGRLVGVRVHDQLSGEIVDIKAKKVVNAAGPWVDTIRDIDGSKEGKRLHLTKGVHLVFDQSRFPLNQATYFDTPDGRMVFAIPREGKTYIGTTDTNYTGDIVHPRMTLEDRDYIIRAANFMFPSLNLTPADMESSWSGLRPLIHEDGKSPSELSRKDEIFIAPSGLITIAGGKLTGYRKMAERIVNLVASQLQTEEGRNTFPACSTASIVLSGGDTGGSRVYSRFVQDKIAYGKSIGLTDSAAGVLVRRYGSNVDQVFELYKLHHKEAEQYAIPGEWFASLLYSIEAEMVATPHDFFIRRTGALYFNIEALQRWKQPVTAYMAERFGWSESETDSHVQNLERHIRDAVEPLSTESK